jgi:hypothetical protein
LNQCNDYIESIYKNELVNNVINKIEPIDLRDDLKHELVIVLYDYECEYLINLHNQNKLITFCLKVLWNMIKGTQNDFYRTYKKNDIEKAIGYFEWLMTDENHQSMIEVATTELRDKMNRNANEAHESIIFGKYLELQSCPEVAKYFNINKKHIYQVVNKVKNELKTKINEN